MASNRSSLQTISTALRGLLPSFGSRKSKPVTTAEKKSAALSDSKKTVSSDEQKLVIRKTKLSPFEQRLSHQIQQYCLSFLSPGDTLVFLLASHQVFTTHSNRYQPARAQKALSNLVHRLDVEKTLAAIKSKPDILDDLQHPFKLTVTGYGGQKVTRRPCLISALDALDEYDVTKPDAKTEPCAAISSIRGLFAKEHPVQTQIDRQIADASSKQHQDATQKRHQRYLNRIRKFILQVIYCDEISNDSKKQKDFDSDMKTKFVQDFINTAFQLNDAENKEEFDNGEFGVVFDAWQLLDDYIYLFNQFIDERDMMRNTVRDDPTQPILGRYWDRKAWIADSAVYVALHHFALLCHLEVLSSSAEDIANGRKRLTRFNMQSGEDIERLVGTGSTHVFGFFSGNKLARVGYGGGRRLVGCSPARPAEYCKTFVKQKNQQKRALNQRSGYHKR